MKSLKESMDREWKAVMEEYSLGKETDGCAISASRQHGGSHGAVANGASGSALPVTASPVPFPPSTESRRSRQQTVSSPELPAASSPASSSLGNPLVEADPTSLFRALDTNGDGIITRKEFDAAWSKGLLGHPPTAAGSVPGSSGTPSRREFQKGVSNPQEDEMELALSRWEAEESRLEAMRDDVHLAALRGPGSPEEKRLFERARRAAEERDAISNMALWTAEAVEIARWAEAEEVGVLTPF